MRRLTITPLAVSHKGMRCALPFLLLVPAFVLCSCSEQDPKVRDSTDQQSANPPAPTVRPFTEAQPALTYDHDVSPILAAEDDYIAALSAFDYAAKFKSDTPLNSSQREAAYRDALQDYTTAEIARLEQAFRKCFEAMDGMSVKLPDTIHLFSEETIESGAAYTRVNTICMPKRFIANLDDEQLTHLAAHEMFHVISRHNLELRPEIYAILGFLPAEPTALPEPLASLTIANPDAPGMGHVIQCNWQGRATHFLPILHSSRPYRGGSFFQYLQDDLLAVELVEGRAVPILEEGKPVIVRKEDTEDYYQQVGRNTHYTFHPEETTADHFMLLLLRDLEELPHPDKVRALGDILRR